ncbi:MAG: transcription antitermination factor NusB [Planctomycetia bacterium]|nr:transcription antitermination factor NusB [Planctomycetia bacterium]
MLPPVKTPRRSRAREVALQALYRLELNPATTPAELDAFLTARLGHADLEAFARSLVAGVRDRRQELDALLESRAEHWRVPRMAATDRSILRLAAYELLAGDAPGPVVADEAIGLAKRYGTADSGRFVAGLVGRLLADRRAAAAGGSGG